MRAPAIDRDDPAVRARLAVHDFERRERTARIAKALGLFALAGLGPWLAGPVPGEPVHRWSRLTSLYLSPSAWPSRPWTWSQAERQHHAAAAMFGADCGRPRATTPPWTRYGVWVIADGQHRQAGDQ